MKINIKAVTAALLTGAILITCGCSGAKIEQPVEDDSRNVQSTASIVSEAVSDVSKDEKSSVNSDKASEADESSENTESASEQETSANNGESSANVKSSAEASENTETPEASEDESEVSDESSSEESEESIKEASENSKSESSSFSKPDSTDKKESGDLPALPGDDGSDTGYLSNGILIYNRTAYELFYGYDELAKDYSAAISKFKNALGDGVKLYNVLVPTHCGVTLPDRFFSEYGLPDQKEYLNTIIENYNADIIGINAYDIIAHHRDEYVYFNSDHHWTGLAAYYAYKAFCETAGIDYYDLSEMIEGSIEGYMGSLTNYIDESLVNSDTVHYYTLDADTSTTLYNSYGQNPQSTSLIHSYASPSFAYGVFLGGDNPLMVCKNNDGNGKKIAVIHESYGNAFCPYIALTYSETHMIDFRDIEIDLKQYLSENGIDEVIFISNAMSSATSFLCDKIAGLAN